ncbi:MAG: hypothetical protein AAFY24_01935 [Pseudomonadota bacterium]
MSERLSASMLLSTTDAAVWAREFCATAESLGHKDIDESWMIGWFANAMAAQEMAMQRQTEPADFRVPMPRVAPAPPPEAPEPGGVHFIAGQSNGAQKFDWNTGEYLNAPETD